MYERALQEELKLRGIESAAQQSCAVFYKGHEVGYYVADLLEERTLIVEVKCVHEITNVHLAQAINYLTATGVVDGLVINFQNPSVEWRKVIRSHPEALAARSCPSSA